MTLTFIKFSDSDKKYGNESQKTLLVHSKWLQDQRWVNKEHSSFDVNVIYYVELNKIFSINLS